MWLVIDCNVLVDASGQGVREHAAASYTLLEELVARPEFVLAIDSRHRIKQQYNNRINPTMYAHNWLLRLLPNRIKAVPRTLIPRGASVALRETHFDQNDLPLVEAAYGSGKIIVTRDFRSFTDSVKTILRRRLDLTVFTARNMLDDLALRDQNRAEKA